MTAPKHKNFSRKIHSTVARIQIMIKCYHKRIFASISAREIILREIFHTKYIQHENCPIYDTSDFLVRGKTRFGLNMTMNTTVS